MNTIPSLKLFLKVYGCWLGKSIGGTLGAPYEGCKKALDLHFYDPVPDEAVPNDDLDLQLVWLDVLRKKGIDITSQDLGQAWLRHITYPFDEYGVAIANLKMGLEPPATGFYNNWFQNGLGAAIRSEIWAAIANSNPEVAVHYAYQDASVDHYGEGIYAEIFLSALESAAFVCGDMNKLVETGLSFLPSTCKIYHVVELVSDLYHLRRPPVKSREEVLGRFGHFNFTDCVQNIGFVVLGLLYGEGDFERTVLAAVNCGYDTDCTAATAGAIMGIILGADGIPAKWRAPIGDKVAAGTGIKDIEAPADLKQLTEWTIKVSRVLNGRENPAVVKPIILAEPTVTVPPLNFPCLIDGKEKVVFRDCHFDLSPYLKKPGVLRLETRFHNRVTRPVRLLPASNGGVKLWLDGEEVISHLQHDSIRPAPHYPDQSSFADLELREGEHHIVMQITCHDKPLNLSWIISNADCHLVTDLEYTWP